MTYKSRQLLVRMNYNTFVRLKAVFRAYHNESMASYFSRLAIKLEMEKAAATSTADYTWSSST